MKNVAYAEVDCGFGDEMQIVHCPICGAPTMEVDKDGFGKVKGCRHLEFIYVNEANDFEYKSEEFEKNFENVDMEEFCLDNFKETLESIGYKDNLLALEVTEHGMACGPVSMTNVFAFNYKK